MKRRSPKRATAREIAYRVLLECYSGQSFSHHVLDDMLSERPLSPLDASLAAELVIGVTRHRITAEHIASRFYKGRWAGLRESIRVLLALGVYQLCWLDRIPDHAAVDEIVTIGNRQGRETAGVLNAVLRKIAECRGDVIECPETPDPRCYLAIDETRGRVFSQNIFPDPARKPLDYLVAAMGHPPYLVERWHRRFKPALCRQVCEAGQRRPPLALRPNPLRCTREELAARLTSDGLHPVLLDGSQAVLIRDAGAAVELDAVREGLCQPQDATSQIALTLAPPQRGQFVVDLCAGVGTKSTQAAEMMANDGLVLASDIDENKLERIPDAAARLGLSIIETVHADGLRDAIARTGRTPDLIFADVPCSNTGVLARRPDARFRASHKALMELLPIQREILATAAALAGDHTRLIYSTCSLEAEENEEQVRAFCETTPGRRIERDVFTLPDPDRDGGYAALIVRE